ncbi:transcriptional regulator [Alkalibacillus almallahensis]|uniref:transcriptional regulator n=1 Tax=Alkalibacillus almallahensis TaxID=1379154 RepID=UPI0014218E01|nr:transcriptional regulator [Alkalibacillus almallahensis]NIK10907.1 RinA family phage transcriptional activator [Alkalibacillus almallahensis]
MAQAIKLSKQTFKKIEAEWFNYHQTLKEIAMLREEIHNPHIEQTDDERLVIEGNKSTFEPSSPTEKIATRLTTNKQLNYLCEVTDAIEQVYQALPHHHQKLVRVRFWSKNRNLTWDGIAEELNVSRRQAIRWRDEIIHLTNEVLGWR